jgi:3-oxoacyl-[acyl-carrier protein] reductase
VTGRFEGRRAIVTGGAQGIGLACVERLVTEGARVILAEVMRKRGAAAVKALGAGDRVRFVHTDIADEASVAACVDATIEVFGGVDVLVNNASLAFDLDLRNSSLSYMRRIFEVNLFGALHMTAAVSPAMAAARYGRIVNVASDSVYGHAAAAEPPPEAGAIFPGLVGPGWALTSYAWAKSGVLHFTKVAAAALGPWGITVNAVAPGVTLTEATKKQLPPDRADGIALASPLKQLSEPADPAASICFLASDDARMLTGQVLVPNGGGHMTA